MLDIVLDAQVVSFKRRTESRTYSISLLTNDWREHGFITGLSVRQNIFLHGLDLFCAAAFRQNILGFKTYIDDIGIVSKASCVRVLDIKQVLNSWDSQIVVTTD